MRRQLLALAALVAAAAVAPAALAKEPARVAPSEDAPRGQILEWTSAEGVRFEYLVPGSYARERGATLLLMLHGSNLDRTWAFLNFRPPFRRDDIIVSPDGDEPNGQGRFNFTGRGGGAGKLAALIRLFHARFRVERTYVYGHSLGGFFALYLLGEHPALVDAVCAHAGGFSTGAKHPPEARGKPIALLHARADEVPLSNSEDARERYTALGYRNVKLQIIEDVTREDGHWPRPKETEALLAWCDGLTAATPWSLLRSAAALVASDEPALGRAADLAKRAGAAAKTLKKKEEREQVEKDAQAVAAAAGEACAAQVEALRAAPGGEKPKEAAATFGPFTARYLAARPWCEGAPAWRDIEKPLAALLAKHERAARAGLAAAEQARAAGAAGAAFKHALRAFTEGFLAREGYAEAARLLAEGSAAPPAGAGAADVQSYRDEAARRAALLAEAREAAAGAHRAVLARLRERAPALFGAPGEAAPGEDE